MAYHRTSWISSKHGCEASVMTWLSPVYGSRIRLDLFAKLIDDAEVKLTIFAAKPRDEEQAEVR